MSVRRYAGWSDLRGLSVLTRTTLLGLEARREPVEQVVVDRHRMVADSKDRPRGDCATWGCCPPTVGVWTLLMMLEPEMRRRDRERLYA